MHDQVDVEPGRTGHDGPSAQPTSSSPHGRADAAAYLGESVVFAGRCVEVRHPPAPAAEPNGPAPERDAG